MNSIYNRTDEESSVIGEVQDNFIANYPLYQQGFKAGAASRDAKIQRLQMALADTEQLELGTAERCDQLREQVVLLRDALKEAVEDYSDRFDMSSPSTNPGIKMVVKQGKEALAATEPKK